MTDTLQTSAWKTTKVPPAVHAIIKAEAAKNGMSLSDLTELILIDWIRRQGLAAPEPQREGRSQGSLFL